LHLDQTEVDPHLKFLVAIISGHDADLKLVGIVVPPGQDRCDVLAQDVASSGPFDRGRCGRNRNPPSYTDSPQAWFAPAPKARRRATRPESLGAGRAASRRQPVSAQSSLPSWIIGSSSFVFRSTARTIVRSSTPSGLAATAGMIWRESGRLNRTVNVPSGRSCTGSPCRVTLAFGSVAP